jgi:transcription-repair coupling factor (superfamily II helicase)
VQVLAEKLKIQGQNFQLKGLVGSLDAVLIAAIYLIRKKIAPEEQENYVIVTHDRDEAFYFQNDLQNLLPQEDVLIFPASYKRPYQFEEIENANIVQRAEVLSVINQTYSKTQKNFITVTYPEALAEKVINKKSLLENTFVAKVGENLSMDFIAEVLSSYDFEKVDFVYEAGQFAIRGGIMDIFSYSNDIPYRMEFFGDEIESIRLFDPHTQLSVEDLKFATLIPNVQTKLTQEVRESFWEFVPENTKIWWKDLGLLLDTVENYYEKVSQYFASLIEQSGGTQIVKEPEVLFEQTATVRKLIQKFTQIEFGNRFYLNNSEVIEFKASAQPAFKKNFELLTKDLDENQAKGYVNLIVSDSLQQINRLQGIFEEIDPFLKFNTLPIALREGFIDQQLKLACYTDHQIFERFHRYRAKEKFSKAKALTLKELSNLQIGDYVTHIDYGIGRFAGLEKQENEGKVQEAVRLIYRDNDILYVNVHSLHKITKYSGKDGSAPVMSKLGSQEWENKKKKVKRRLQDIATELIQTYAKRKIAPGYGFGKDNYLMMELESSFLYEETPDQAKAIEDVKEDMEKAHPMDRLVCGDVGFGKTEVAIRAAFKAVCDSKQVAVLVPTTILAMQHYRTFSERLANLPCKVDYINRFRSTQQIKETLKKLEKGEVDIIIGTHRLVSNDVKFKDLGLMIIDEEQKFGVKTKDKLKEFKVNVDVLTLTATPIPRTLHFSLLGARDLSIISTPPPNRQPVTTEIHTFNEAIIRDTISRELKRGGQVFFVHNRVGDIDSIANLILKLVPEARIGVAHGQMEGDRLEKIMLKFIAGEYDILVSTNIIESGLDISNANTIIINMAHTFGLSDLHQMRGRVGRSNRKAYCILLAPATSLLTSDSRKRLGTLEEFSDIGDGFKVAMRDLDIRGAGNLLGAEQSGFINDLGYDAYHKILDEAVRELKETEFKDLFANELNINALKTDCSIETDLQILIPDKYIQSISERLSLYTQLDNILNEEELAKFQNSLIDRFGEMPAEVKELIETVKLRWLAESIGFEKLSLKNDTLKGYFLDKPDYFQSEKFSNIIRFLQKNPNVARLKDHNQKPIIIFSKIQSIQQAKEVLSLL